MTPLRLGERGYFLRIQRKEKFSIKLNMDSFRSPSGESTYLMPGGEGYPGRGGTSLKCASYDRPLLQKSDPKRGNEVRFSDSNLTLKNAEFLDYLVNFGSF